MSALDSVPDAMPSGRDQTTTMLRMGDVQQPVMGAIVRVLNAPARPAFRRLGKEPRLIGAGRDADVIIDDEAVSRSHAELTLVPDGVMLRDLGSRNGTFYLGQRVDSVVLAIGSHFKLGRVELVVKPDHESAPVLAPSEATSYGDLLGASTAMRKLFSLLRRLEGTLVHLLINGESGTGKELVARAVHQHSRVKSGPFVAVNCGAMDRSLARSDLFGHKRGAFTGSTESRAGAFEAASGGTLLLDELGELPADVQPLLLRALETGAVVRVGETQERPVNVRVIAATHRDLAQSITTGRFREDLYYRLNVVRIDVPPLRDRPEDIEQLAHHFATSVGVEALPEELLADLRQRSWPGNVRELRNAIQAYGVLGIPTGSPVKRSEDLESVLRRSTDVGQTYAHQKALFLAHFSRVYLGQLLEQTAGNQSEAARLSGLDRSHLNKLVAKLGLGRG